MSSTQRIVLPLAGDGDMLSPMMARELEAAEMPEVLCTLGHVRGATFVLNPGGPLESYGAAGKLVILAARREDVQHLGFFQCRGLMLDSPTHHEAVALGDFEGLASRADA